MSRILFAAAAISLSALPAAAGCVGQCYQQTYVPPSYETVTERVMTRAPRTYALTTPAQYSTVHETVQVSPGGRHWSVTTDAHGRQIGCWISTPPRYATVARTVMVQQPQVVPYSEPAQYGYRSHTVQTASGYRAWSPVGHGYQASYATQPSYGRSYAPSYQAAPSPRRAYYGETQSYRRPVASRGYDRGYDTGRSYNSGYETGTRRNSGFGPLSSY